MSTATLSVDSRMDASKQRTLIQRHPIASVLILAIAVPETLFHLPYFFQQECGVLPEYRTHRVYSVHGCVDHLVRVDAHTSSVKQK